MTGTRPAPTTAVARRLAVGLTLALAGCADATSPADAWADARARWDRQRLSDYSYEYRAECFCIANLTQWHRVEVRGGRVVAVTPVAPLPFPAEPAPPVEAWPTVDRLFEVARTPRSRDILEVTARYDASRGYPLEIRIRCSDRLADCGGGSFARNLVPRGP